MKSGKLWPVNHHLGRKITCLTSHSNSFTVLNMSFDRKTRISIVLCSLLSFILITQITAQTAHPSFEPLFSSAEVLNQNIDSTSYTTYTADQIFEMGLLFSECQRGSQTWNSSWQKFEAIKNEATSDEIMALSQEERGRAILKLLYRDYLKTYSLNQTKLDLALESGLYNCVSSAVLYMAAAKAAGLDVRGQRTSEHAFCSIYVPVSNTSNSKSVQLKKIDVETTNPYGFNPGSKEEIEHTDQIKKYYVVPKKYYSNRSEVSDGIFTGLIAGNLTSEYIKTGDYIKALPLGAARWNTIKAEPVKSTASVRYEFDILAANYVNLLPDSAAAYSSTLDWFSSFIDRWGKTEFLQKNLDTSFINLLVLCNREGNYQLASTAYEKYKGKITTSQLTKADEIITDIIILTATDGLSFENKIVETNKLITSGDLSAPARQNRAQLHLESFWLESLNESMNSRDYELGYTNATQALNQLPKSTKIKAMQNAFYNNSIAIIHNNFARLANSGNFEEAQAALESGLEKFPNDRTLKKDLADLLKVRKQLLQTQ